jgi:hypothetical protein
MFRQIYGVLGKSWAVGRAAEEVSFRHDVTASVPVSEGLVACSLGHHVVVHQTQMGFQFRLRHV